MLLHLKFNLLFHLNLVLNIISICCWILCTFGFESPLNLHFYLTLVWCWISLPFGVLSGQFGDTISIISISCWISFLFAGVLTRIWFGVESPFHLVLNLVNLVLNLSSTSSFCIWLLSGVESNDHLVSYWSISCWILPQYAVKSDACLVLNLSQVWC